MYETLGRLCKAAAQRRLNPEARVLQDDADMADWEEAAGISAPLYEIVDTVFELQSRGFFRRQVREAHPHITPYAHAIL